MEKQTKEQELEKEINDLKKEYDKPMRMGRDMKVRLMLLEKEAELKGIKEGIQIGLDQGSDICKVQLAQAISEFKEKLLNYLDCDWSSYSKDTQKVIKDIQLKINKTAQEITE
jgi:hypothetical protein